ncbi:reverse transcriptase family protein [Streptococcus dysgalactiae subsp. equisimilis]|nr:reverse transcriptase family protein [Streptococcus dysgalactiae subsp. equisimilis]
MTVVTQLSVLMKNEIHRLNEKYVESLIGNTNRDVWKAIKQLCGTKKNPSLDLDKLNLEFAAAPSSHILPPPYPSHESSTPIEPYEVLRILNQLKLIKSCGPNAVSPAFLKACAEHLSTPLCELFNNCLSHGAIPVCWKSVRIRPIPKKGSNKFRPIACTSVLLKVFEKILLNRLEPICNSPDRLQFAYKRSLSTLDALTHIVHSVASTLDKGNKTVRLTFLDYANAFGSLDRSVLIHRLSGCGVKSDILNVLIDYFTDRTQFTSSNGHSSASLPIDSGVFQGAILSPFFFSLYISNLPIPTNFIACKYADDVVYGCTYPSPDKFHFLQENLNSLSDWSVAHSLKLNAQKCADLPFSLKKEHNWMLFLIAYH